MEYKQQRLPKIPTKSLRRNYFSLRPYELKKKTNQIKKIYYQVLTFIFEKCI